MASKSHAVIIMEHLQSRFHWWYSLYNSLLETAAAYEKDMPFSFDPYADAAMIENLNQDAEYARVISVGLAEELGRAESAIAPKPQPKPDDETAKMIEHIETGFKVLDDLIAQAQVVTLPDVSDIPFAVDEKLPPVVSLANVTQFCTYSESSCGAPNDRALMIYRRAVADGIIKHGEKLLVHGDLDELLNSYEWGDLVTAADEPLPTPFAAVDAQPVDEVLPLPMDCPAPDPHEKEFFRGFDDYHSGVEWYECYSTDEPHEKAYSDGWHYAKFQDEALRTMKSQPAESVAPKRKPRKPYHVWQPNYKWPVAPRVIRVPVLGEVS